MKAEIQHWWTTLCSDDLCCWLSDFINEGHLVAEASHGHDAPISGYGPYPKPLLFPNLALAGQQKDRR